MDYQVRKVVMTGGSGPVGLALIRKLLSENVEILLFQRKNSPKRIYLPDDKRLHIEFCSLDMLDQYNPKEDGYDVFFHLGWANTDSSHRDNIYDQYGNIMYSCNAVELACKLGCHSFIGIGSQAEYGRHNEPLREDTLCIPENAYGAMKLSACHTTRLLCKKYGMRHIWPRILSAYGKFDNIKSVLVSSILKALEGRKLEFSKGEQIWDFVYLDDVANALFLIAKRGRDEAVYPIGGRNARPLREYLEILCEKLGGFENAEFGKIPYFKGQIMHLEADISSLQEDTGWNPEVEFEEGIKKTIGFYMDWKANWESRFLERCKELEEIREE